MSAAPSVLSRRAILVLALLAVLPYLNGLPNGFTYDDGPIIRDNPLLESPAKLPRIFQTHYFGGTMATGTAYRPVILLTYAVQKWIHGNRPWAFRLVNVGLHAGATLLLASWLLSAGFPKDPALAAAALFAVVPIHVEAVTSLVGRAELLAAFLVFLAARLWARATAEDRLLLLPYAACLSAFLAAVFVKENAVVLPGVVLLFELFRGGHPRPFVAAARDVLRRRAGALIGLFVPVVVLFAARRAVLGDFLARRGEIWDLENPLIGAAAPDRIAAAAGLLFRYIAKTFVPAGLAADHSAYALDLPSRWSEPVGLAALGGLAILVLTIPLLWRRRPGAAFGLAFFFGTFLPTANLLFPIGTLFAERLMYLPSAGLLFAVASLAAPPAFAVPRPARDRGPAAILATALIVFSTVTVLRNRVWRDDLTLYRDMIEKVPGSAKARYDLGWELMRLGRKPEAESHLLRGVAIFPRHYDSWGLLARLAWDDGRLDEAISRYRRSVEAHTLYENGRWGLAKTLEEAGRFDEAGVVFDESVAVLPKSYPLAWHRAAFLEDRGRLDEAEVEWARAAGLSTGTELSRLRHARLLDRLGCREEAWNEARRALVANPGLVEARLFLSESYEAAGKTLAAAGELTRAVRSKPSDAEAARRLLEFGLRRPAEGKFRAACAAPGIRRSLVGPVDARVVELLARYGA